MRRCLLTFLIILVSCPPAAASVECMLPLETTFELSGHRYILPMRFFQPEEDITADIRMAYGPEAVIVDWRDLKRRLDTTQLVQDFLTLSEIRRQTQDECDNFYVSVDGQQNLEGHRYFFARHDGEVPPDWFVLDTIGAGTLDLGRWDHPSRVLIEVPLGMGSPPAIAIAPADETADLSAPDPAVTVDLGRRVALVVANASYQGAPLENPTVDADLVEPVLQRMGFGVTVVKNADLERFAVALDSFYAEAKGADLALFYFAGHGFAVDGQLGAENYLMSTSADVTSGLDLVIRSGGISLDEIVVSIARIAKVSLVFVDACRNDPRVSRGSGGGRGLARIADVAAGETFVGLSTRLGDLAEDGEAGGGSPFARAFAAHMPTPDLPVDEAFRQLRLAVVDETGGRQRPEARDDLNSALVVVNADN